MAESTSLRVRYKNLRKTLLSFTPFVKRWRHERIVAGLSQRLRQEIDREREAKELLAYLFLDRPQPAAAARIVMRAPLASTPMDELCLFVTHAARVDLKPHVVDHVEALLGHGIGVVLIANTDLEASSLRIPDGLASRLQGCIIRENVGFDFGAWAHAYCLLAPEMVRRRLYLINDSIIGPLDSAAHRMLLRRVRESTADLVGLTRNHYPRDHLQSYFLAINQRLLRAAIFDELMQRIVNMPSKQNVIDCYEVWMTQFLESRGFANEAIFPQILRGGAGSSSNDTIWMWKELLEMGFPFVKSGVLAFPAMEADARRIVPARYLAAELTPNLPDHSNDGNDLVSK